VKWDIEVISMSWAVSFWFDREIEASEVPELLPCVHGSTAVSSLKATFNATWIARRFCTKDQSPGTREFSVLN
jgi:hypothetical protein